MALSLGDAQLDPGKKITSDSVFLHGSHLLQREPKRIHHKRNLPSIYAVYLVQFNSNDEE